MGVARVQDSATEVFLSADSLISDPGYTQSYNRYGYVNNNPLSYNDPSGHCPHNNGYTPPDNNGPGYELEEVVVYAYIDDSRSTDYSLADFTPFDWGLLRDWYNDFFNSNNVDSSPAKRAPVPQTQKPEDKPKEKESDRQRCLRENYGDLYDQAFDLSPLSLSSFATDEVTEYLEDSLSRQANRNLYSLRLGVSQQIYQTGKRQERTLMQFRRFNGAMAVVSAGAFGFVAGANAYCNVATLGGS
jgi:hypothetical protein